jgi:hypothetical protein
MTTITYADYKRHIRSLVVEYGRLGVLAGSTPLSFNTTKGIPAEVGGAIQATDSPLRFKDGAKLQVLEIVRVMNGEIELPRYAYHYERPNGYFFRYEREDSTDLIRKPEYHMHVILDLPHFPAPQVNLEIILQVITNNFYSQEVYSRQIIGHEIHLTV